MVRPSRRTSKAAPTRLADRLQPDALFRAVLDSAPDAIAVIDAGGRIVLANAQTERLFGYSAHELLGRPVELLLPERLRAAHVAHWATYRASPRTRPMGAGLDLVARRKDGTEFPVEISLSPVATADGMLITVIVRDVTERKAVLARERQARWEAERATQLLERVQAVSDVALAHLPLNEVLPELLRRIRTLLALDAAAVLLVEDGGATLRVKAVEGLPEATVCIPIGQGFAGRIAAERVPIVIEDTDKVELPNPFLREAGIRSLLGVPLLVDGRVLGVLYVGSRHPRHFTPDDRRLVQLVAERVALASHRSRLYEAERQAHDEAEAALRVRTEAERLKDDLASMVVHDLKNPVNGIAVMIQLMLQKRQGLQEAERRRLRQVDRICREMMRLIQNLLEISKIEDGKMPVVHEAIVLADLVAEVTQEYGQVAGDVGGRVAVAVRNEVMVVADHALLKRVLVNLVVNALRHSASHEVRVEATTDAGSSAVTINVIDHGHGIPADEQAHVFEKFHSRRGDPTADTGLGLPFCKLAVERMGGQIALSSTPGKTTVFSVTLPIYAAGAR